MIVTGGLKARPVSKGGRREGKQNTHIPFSFEEKG